MSKSYGYALLKDGVPVAGGSKKYHVEHALDDDLLESISRLMSGDWSVWRLTGWCTAWSTGAVNISDKMISVLQKRKDAR